MVRDAKTILAFIRSADMQKGGPTCRVGRPRCKKIICISDGQPCMSALLFYCFTNLLFYYFTPLQIQYCRGRCLGLAARDAKKFSKYYHVLQQNVVFASRTANLACRPSYSTVLLFYYFIFSLHARDAKNVFASRTAKLACRPSYSTVLLICYFTILLQIQYCRGRCLGLARDAKMFSTYYHTYYHILPRTWYYHVLQKNVVFASRTANRACRPSYSTVLLFYYLRYSTAVADVWGWPPEMQKKKLHLGRPTLHVGPPIYCFTNLLFYCFTLDKVLFGRPRCEKNLHVLPCTTTYYHVLQQNVNFASRTAKLACRPSYSTVLLFYYFSISLQIQYCRGRCLWLAARDAKKFSKYYHVLQQNVVFASRTANLACRPSYSTVLLFHSRYSTAAADVWGWPPEMQKSFPRTTTYCSRT